MKFQRTMPGINTIGEVSLLCCEMAQHWLHRPHTFNHIVTGLFPVAKGATLKTGDALGIAIR